jgi:hypothetical protein
MSERKDDKWLDKQLQRAVDGTTPVFDAQAWKRKHPEEYQALLARGKQTVGRGLAHRFWTARRLRWGKPHPTTIGRLVVAALIVLAVGLLVPRGGNHVPEVSAPPVVNSAGSTMSMMSLRMAYQRGGLDSLDQQLHNSLDEFGPRSSGVSMQELF